MVEARQCLICQKIFTPKRCAIYCSKICWWKSPKGKKLQKRVNSHPKWIEKKRECARKNSRSIEGQNYRRWFASKKHLRLALQSLGLKSSGEENVSYLYATLRGAAKCIEIQSPSGRQLGQPDAKESCVEFKIGMDCLRFTQLIYNVFHGDKGKVRWFPSWDSLERLLEKKGRDESLFFNSYLSYLRWCEKQMLSTVKRRKQKCN
jgi:hypothetical protein